MRRKLEEVETQLFKLQATIAACTDVARLRQYAQLATSLLRQYRDLHKSLRAGIRTWDKLANSGEAWLTNTMGSAALPQSVIQHLESRRHGRANAMPHPQDATEMSTAGLGRTMFWSSPGAREEDHQQRHQLLEHQQTQQKKQSMGSSKNRKINWNG